MRGIDIAVGVVFLFAGFAKMRNRSLLTAFIEEFTKGSIGRYSEFVTRILVSIEIAIGMGLFLQFYEEYFRGLALLLLTLFVLVLGVALVLAGKSDSKNSALLNCGCLGTSSVSRSGAGQLYIGIIRNVVLILVILWTFV